jgi:hypothetical protein
MGWTSHKFAIDTLNLMHPFHKYVMFTWIKTSGDWFTGARVPGQREIYDVIIEIVWFSLVWSWLDSLSQCHQTFSDSRFEFTSITLTWMSFGCIVFSLMLSAHRVSELVRSSLKLPLIELRMVCWPTYSVWVVELPSLVLRRNPNLVGRLNCLFTWNSRKQRIYLRLLKRFVPLKLCSCVKET